MRNALTLVALSVAFAAGAHAQTPTRRAATVEAVRTYPGFFHGQPVVLVGKVAHSGEDITISNEAGSVRLVSRTPVPDGLAEVRGYVLDVGRIDADDPRVLQLDLRPVVERAYGDRWPKPGEEIVVSVTSADTISAQPGTTSPPIRAIALEPARFTGQTVTVTGQFRGRNLFADLPQAPVGGRWDFVLRSADGALWVTGLRPRGKDFSLDPARRVDTGGWFRISGTVRAGNGLVWIEGATIERAQPIQETIVEVPAPPLPVAPLEILFGTPIEGESDVRLDSRIRIQFSRDVEPASLNGRIRLSYSRSDSIERGEPQPPAIDVTINYSAPNRSLEIRPRQPLERFRQVTVELLEGIKGPDGASLKPWKLTFSTGGS